MKQTFFRKGVAKTILLSNIITLISLALMNKDINFQIIFSLMMIFPVLAIANHIDSIFYEEYRSGALDFLIITTETINIVITKIFSFFLIIFVTILSHCIMGMIFFKISSGDIIKLIFPGFCMSLLAACIVTVAGAMRIYFEKNNNILSISALQLLIPEFVLCGLYFHNPINVYLYLLGGIAMILTPISIFLINHLLKELYNS